MHQQPYKIDVGGQRQNAEHQRDDLAPASGFGKPSRPEVGEHCAESPLHQSNGDREEYAELGRKPDQSHNGTGAGNPAGFKRWEFARNDQQQGHNYRDEGDGDKRDEDGQQEIERIAESGAQIKAGDDYADGCSRRSAPTPSGPGRNDVRVHQAFTRARVPGFGLTGAGTASVAMWIWTNYSWGGLGALQGARMGSSAFALADEAARTEGARSASTCIFCWGARSDTIYTICPGVSNAAIW